MTQSLSDIAAKLAEIDTAMFVTKTEGGAIAARPMSNNGDVQDDGTTYHFTTDDGRIDDDLKRSSECGATYDNGNGFWAAVQGQAKLITDRAEQEKHWVPDLEKWFADGLDTEGLILIEVTARRIHYWDGRDEGELMPGA